MHDPRIPSAPPSLAAILHDTEALGFKMASEAQTGSLLRTLAASKPGGRLLELGTGTGVGTAWLLDDMDAESRLVTVDNNDAAVAVARKHLGCDTRVAFELVDAEWFLRGRAGERFDLVFADAWPGKFTDLDLALALVAPGGFYIADDLLPQPSWPEGHSTRIPTVLAALARRADLLYTTLAWASGIIVVTKRRQCIL